MTNYIDLATKLVILVTAVVGLLAVRKTVAKTTVPTSDGPFDTFLRVLGAYATVLVPLLFMFGFMGLIGLMSSLFESRSSPQVTVNVDSLAIAWGVEREPAYAMMLAAQAIDRTTEREAGLVRAARVALAHGKPQIGWLSARELSSQRTRDSVLAAVVTGFVRKSEFPQAAAVLVDFSSTRLKENAARLILNSVEKDGYASPRSER